MDKYIHDQITNAIGDQENLSVVFTGATTNSKFLNITKAQAEHIRDYLSGSLTEPVKRVVLNSSRPVELSISMDTDDDCEIIYKGDSYCFYGSDLEIIEEFSSMQEAVLHLRKELKVVHGFKASEYTHEWLNDVIRHMLKFSHEAPSYSGNQKFTTTWKFTDEA